LFQQGFSGTTLDNPRNEIYKIVEGVKERAATETKEAIKGQYLLKE